MDKLDQSSETMAECKSYASSKEIENSNFATTCVIENKNFASKSAAESTGKKVEDNNNELIKDAPHTAAEKIASFEKSKKIPDVECTEEIQPPEKELCRPLPAVISSNPGGRPIILATYLVPSLPISLFEVFAEAIEAATGKPVVLLYESSLDKPFAKDIADIAILPPGEKWQSGQLLPVSFVFEHRLNKTFSPAVYADVVVATDRAPHVEDIMDLRGHRCALPDRSRSIGATALLFNQLQAKGEGPSFFGNILDARSQISALQMVSGKQVEVCVLESPVIKYHRKSLPGVYSLHVLSCLGPLPPYPIMIHKNMTTTFTNKIKEYLLKTCQNKTWLEKFAPYSVLGFAEYNPNLYEDQEVKPVVTSAPYY